MEKRPHFKQNSLKYTKGYKLSIFIHNIFTFLLVSFAATIIATTSFIYISQPVRDMDDNLTTARSVTRLIKEGERVMFIQTPNYNMFTPIVRFTTPQEVYKGEVVAGPFGKILVATDKTIIRHENRDRLIDLTASDLIVYNEFGDELQKEYLDKEYVVRVMSEDGQESKDFLVNPKDIIGIVNQELLVS